MRNNLIRRSAVALTALAWALGCDAPATCPEGSELDGAECVRLDAGPDGSRPELDAGTPRMDAAADMDAATPAPDGGPMPMEDGGTPPPLPDAGPPTCPDPGTWYRDFDMDGRGDPSASIESCEPVEGFVTNADDCNDTCDSCYDGAEEVCDGRDNDCDGIVDDGVTTAYYADADGDGRGNPAVVVNACSPPAGHVDNADDCDDTCSACWTGASESCDGEDNDCDGSTDEGAETTYYLDADGDGRGNPARSVEACSAPPAHVDNADDCDDTCSACWTGAAETCDGEDNDCDGTADEGVTTTYYRDADGDGRGDPSSDTEACSRPAGHVENANDCNDACDVCWTGATEVCDGRDNDCEGGVDEGVLSMFYRDADGDSFGDPSVNTQACSAPSGYSTDATDCNDECALCHPGNVEVCDGLDNDCDGAIDDGVRLTFYRDADGDGHGNPATSMQACTRPAGYVTSSDDCDDGCATCYPGNAEVCDGEDNDCDSVVDDGVLVTYYRDSDGDGHGNPAMTTQACTLPSGYATVGDDCNDGAATIHPGRAESCNAIDDDCDGMPDETFSCVRGSTVSCTTSCGSMGTGTCTASCGLPTGTSCTPPAEICNGRDDDCDGLADENLFTAGAPRVDTYPVDFRRPQTVRVGSYLYSFWESSGTVSGWRLSRDGTPTSLAQVPLGGSAKYDVDGSGSSLGFAYVDAAPGDFTGPVVVKRISTSSLATLWTRSLAVAASQVEIAVGSSYIFVFTSEASGRIYRRVLNASNGAVIGSPELVGDTYGRPFDVVDDDGDRQLLVYPEVEALKIVAMRGTTTPSITGTHTYTKDVDGLFWDVAIASSWQGSATMPNFVTVFSTVPLLGSDTRFTNLYYLSHRSGSTRTLGSLWGGSTPTDGSEPGGLDIEYADGIYLMAGVMSFTDPVGDRGTPYAIQLTPFPIGSSLTIRRIGLGLPIAVHESISVVRFPDNVGYPDRVFYNPSVNGIASIPIGCH